MRCLLSFGLMVTALAASACTETTTEPAASAGTAGAARGGASGGTAGVAGSEGGAAGTDVGAAGGVGVGGSAGAGVGGAAVGGAGNSGGVAADGNAGWSGVGGNGCVILECKGAVCNQTGCCHDPCVDGESCGAEFHMAGPAAVDCVCTNGRLDCCTDFEALINCHLARTCAQQATGEACIDCLYSAYLPGAFDTLFEPPNPCLCAADTCADACGGTHGKCGTGSTPDDACAACMLMHVEACAMSSEYATPMILADCVSIGSGG